MEVKSQTTPTLKEMIDNIHEVISFAHDCIVHSTEYKIGHPAYEKCSADLYKAMTEIV